MKTKSAKRRRPGRSEPATARIAQLPLPLEKENVAVMIDHRRVNVAESARCAGHRDVRARWGHCYANACRIIWYAQGYEDADYVEGIAVCPDGQMIEHGWVERDGQIIDPTHARIDGVAYFPGLRLHGRAGIAEAGITDYHDRDVFHPDLPVFYCSDCRGICHAKADAMEYLKRLTSKRP